MLIVSELEALAKEGLRPRRPSAGEAAGSNPEST
jgi:hypothetical protein